MIMTQEEKAKRYDEALKRARKLKENPQMVFYEYSPKEGDTICDYIFPELKVSNGERIRNFLIDYINHIDWGDWDFSRKQCIAWLEKQGEQKQLYIRFGEIPTDEKSKIYRGEIEVGTENGVSVYPAFKTDEGDIVLGLSLPITKTTLYTQQHLIEYDDRPCYLVNGDYVGKDTDGQPLINNVSIIKKIDSYRIKEKKQGEQKSTIEMITPEESLGIDSETYNKIVDECIYGEQKYADKVEPRFKVGDWIVDKSGFTQQVLDFRAGIYTCTYNSFTIDCESNYHLWTIQDAKDGDVLVTTFEEDNMILMYHSMCTINTINVHCCLDNKFTRANLGVFDVEDVKPATKEQRDLLFQKIHEAGYMWDSESKRLLSLKVEPDNIETEYKVGDWIVQGLLDLM